MAQANVWRATTRLARDVGRARDEIQDNLKHLEFYSASKLVEHLTHLADTLVSLSAGVYHPEFTNEDIVKLSAEVSKTRADVYHALWIAGGGWRDAAEKLVLK